MSDTFPTVNVRAADGGVTPELLAKALETVSEGSLITDAQRNTIYANTAFTTITGYRLDDIIGTNCRFLQGPETSPETVDQIRAALSAGQVFQGEILNYRADGRPFWNHLTITPMLDEHGVVTHFVSVQRDVTDRVDERDQLSYAATHDVLTGLPNRAGLRRHVARELADAQLEGTAVAVVVIDLDLFKRVNDVHGHQAGDEVLVEVARRATSALRRGDYVARLGGDEFVVVISDLKRSSAIEQITQVLARLHTVVETPFVVADGEAVLGASAGVAIYPDHTLFASELYRLGDDALYAAKARREGDSWWVLAQPAGDSDSPVRVLTSRPMASGAELPASSVLELGAIEMFFQPVVDLHTGAVASVEALARLRTREGRILGPQQFLPFCSTRDLVTLFREGLDQALAQVSAWDREGVALNVSVNIPPELLSDDETAEWVSTTLDSHGLAAERLSLELLESGTLDLAESDRNVAELVRLGVRIHLDDISSGFSTLKRMTELPFDVIKIDRRIFEAAHVRPLQVITLLAAITRLGSDFGYGVVVEGIEDVEKFEVSVALGAGRGQGFLFARPLEAEHVLPWVRDFALPHSPQEIVTPLGALAFHWAAANQHGRLLPALADCPLTPFSAGVSTELSSLHEQYHLMGGDRNPAGSALNDALVELVCAEADSA